jgi:hypothetical protein
MAYFMIKNLTANCAVEAVPIGSVQEKISNKVIGGTYQLRHHPPILHCNDPIRSGGKISVVCNDEEG